MAQGYRLVVASPTTAGGLAKTWAFDAASGKVLSIQTELKKDKQRISVLTAKLYDPKWDIFSELPDPAFANVPVTFYLSEPSRPTSVPILVFEGKVTSLQPGFPGPSHVTIVAHDKTIDMRRQKAYRTFRNLTSVQLAQAIAKLYGLTVDVDTGGITPTQRTVEMGPEVSDWDLVGRSLAANGLELYSHGSKLVVRQAAGAVYKTTFRRGSPPVVRFEAQINHVHGPGEGGDTHTQVALENRGTAQALKGGAASEAALMGASSTTHRRDVQAPTIKTGGAHSEDTAGKSYEEQGVAKRRRKDSASLTCTALPDIGLQHKAALEGWGAKVDDQWFIESIRHTVVSGTDYAQTSLALMRGPSPGAAKSTGIPFAR